MDPYSHPSAIPVTPRERLQQESAAAASSSSSNFDLYADDRDTYSPAEVHSIDAVHFDSPDGTRMQPAYIPSSATTRSCNNIHDGSSNKFSRLTEVSIEADPPSVPASPLGRAQESVRQFRATLPLPDRAVAAPTSISEVIARYTSNYHGGVEASLHYVLAIMNPSSGETSVSRIVLAGLRDELGTRRVLTLNGELFADPAPLRVLIKEQAVIYHPPGQPRRQQRGTVVACGGDGTVSFMMTQMDLVKRELEAEFQPFLTPQDQEQVLQHREGSTTGRSLPEQANEVDHPYFTIPALAPLPLGTGNDYSNCVGFGKGFSPSGGGCCSGLWALCGCGDGGESQVAAALMTALSAPCVAFDQWEVSLVPLQLAQRTLRADHLTGSPLASASSSTVAVARDAPNTNADNEPNRTNENSSAQSKEGNGSGNPRLPKFCAEGASLSSICASPLAPSSKEGRSRSKELWSRVVHSSNVASGVNLIDWEKLYATKQVATYGLINYLSVGYDAYVATKFDATRRAYPAVCSTRTKNKAVYVSHGIGGAMRCKKLRKLIPMICVPRPALPGASKVASTSAATATTDAAAGNGNPSDEPAGDRDLIALQLPSITKSLVVTNVSCYGAGTHPWDPSGGELYYRPVTLRDGELVQSSVITAPNKDAVPLPAPVPRPVSINDRAFEVQSMGGFLHYSSLGVGLMGAVKLLQTHEMFAFVLCTPEDLQFPSGQCSVYTQRQFIDKYMSRIGSDVSVHASLCVQIDGEAMPSITEPTIIHMRRRQGSRILVRCRNASVVL